MKLTYINLGCGNRFHNDWINIDFNSESPHVKAHNLLDGIPMGSNTVDVVYHSHLLEHFEQQQAVAFMKECHRILRPGGIIRIAVPDLERIAREYLYKLQGALSGNKQDAEDYEWIMLELFDQMVRNTSGGEMVNYLTKSELVNEEYVYSRIGYSGKEFRKNHLLDKQTKRNKEPSKNYTKRPFLSLIKIPIQRPKNRFKSLLLKSEIEFQNKFKKEAEIGRFRSSGEIHKWMYDRYSLAKILSDQSFQDIRVKSAFESSIPNWSVFKLDINNGMVIKPDSIFIEATQA